MSKEMIISVNGREKKIAILDGGKVTEFYIERGDEENSGVVGNIYKGRVMRVLPGMQSAFVDIGLERDAFLYVSDFFDEEEEIERIVMEKSKKISPEEAKREANDQIERQRLEREKQMEAVQEIAEPIAESENEEAEAVAEQEEIQAEKGGEPDEQPHVKHEETRQFVEDAQSKNQGKNRRRGKKEREAARENSESNPEISVGEVLSPDFAPEDSNFERIVDEDESVGEQFKDAYVQEAIIDQVRAVEFEMESTHTAEVGSLLNSSVTESSNFERIADEDEEEEPQPAAKTGRNQRGKGGKQTGNVSETADPKGKKQTAKKDGKTKTADETVEAETAAVELPTFGMSGETKVESGAKPSKGKKSSRGKAKKSASADALEDAQASVKDAGETAEMAVRRGGRGRRRGGRGQTDQTDENENAESSNESFDEAENIETETPVIAAERETVEEKPIEREPQTAPIKGYQGGGQSGQPRQNQTRDSRNQRDNRDNRDTRDNRSDRKDARPDNRPQAVAGGKDSRPNNRDNRGGRGEYRSQPTISDLLREGQEILVQIAKEPIARKGARITSHIALPGRFLVYMPTIEHLGVSRKIESANERARLRTLIQSIKREEDVPTGGFIVRTAGVGISDEDLRQDARYLVRTWVDVKKNSERKKSPALAHQDLDIIQRLLRDHLSDEYTAIRVDSEEEYLRIVEFINRIQPRMVNRVKLYTREEPILEAYNVQEEIDKALKPRVWLKSGGYLVINQTEALVAIDVNTGKFVGRGNARLEDTITKTNMEAVDEIARQIRLRDLGGIIVLDLIDMEDRRNRNKVSQALQEALSTDKSPTKVLSFNDFGLIIMTRKRVKQSLERTLCTPCEYCESSGWVKSPQTICYEILEESRRLSKSMDDVKQTTLRVHSDVAEALRTDKAVMEEIEAYLGGVDITADPHIHQAQFDFAFV